jgi:hypothetical protein
VSTRHPQPAPGSARTQLLVWWIAWTAILSGLVIIYLALGRGPVQPAPPADVLVNLVGIVPLFISIVIRWLVLPRYTDLGRALPFYIAGLALAETCGILGIFLGHQYRDDLFVLGVLGVAQYVPLFAKRLQEPKGSGFIPNN